MKINTNYLLIDSFGIFLKDNDSIDKLYVRSIFNKYKIPIRYQKIILRVDSDDLELNILKERKKITSNAHEITTYAPFKLKLSDEIITGNNYLRDDMFIYSKKTEITDDEVISFYQELNDLDINKDYLCALNEILSPVIDLDMTMFNCIKRVKALKK